MNLIFAYPVGHQPLSFHSDPSHTTITKHIPMLLHYPFGISYFISTIYIQSLNFLRFPFYSSICSTKPTHWLVKLCYTGWLNYVLVHHSDFAGYVAVHCYKCATSLSQLIKRQRLRPRICHYKDNLNNFVLLQDNKTNLIKPIAVIKVGRIELKRTL